MTPTDNCSAVRSATMRCRARQTCRPCTSTTRSHPARSTRWAPRASAKQAPTAVLRRSPTRSWMRSSHLVFSISTCPSRRTGCGKRFSRPAANHVDFGLSELQQTIRRETLALAAGFGLDYWREHDRDEAYPWEFVKAFADAGWLGVVIPEAYGGCGLGRTQAGVLRPPVGGAAAGARWASAIPLHYISCTPVLRHGAPPP